MTSDKEVIRERSGLFLRILGDFHQQQPDPRVLDEVKPIAGLKQILTANKIIKLSQNLPSPRKETSFSHPFTQFPTSSSSRSISLTHFLNDMPNKHLNFTFFKLCNDQTKIQLNGLIPLVS
jgi:hypothetical protein